MDNSARADWKLDPKNQSGVFLGFAHRRNLYGAQILVDKSIITARHQIAYDIELFPFQKRGNPNDRFQFFPDAEKEITASPDRRSSRPKRSSLSIDASDSSSKTVSKKSKVRDIKSKPAPIITPDTLR